uniref:Caprin-2 n=1 Tax=Leptobrachium leishanense TaxID=445787 RepID=A0A8C5MRI5_9ANUR
MPRVRFTSWEPISRLDSCKGLVCPGFGGGVVFHCEYIIIFAPSEVLAMVQLSPSSPNANGEPHLVKKAEDCKHPTDGRGSPKQLQPSNSTLTSLQVFENYLDNGLVTLKHKIRNMEKKKVKLDDYKERLNSGEGLNQDQQEAVEKYEEVVHNLDFAKELQKTFSAMNQDLLKTQKKALRRENLLKVELEKRRLRTVFQVQYMLQSYSQDHVLKDFKAGLNGATCMSSKELDCLTKFSKLVCSTRHKHMSLEDQMDHLSIYFWNLLEGSEKTVAGTNYQHLKDLVARMLDSGYFESVPDAPPERLKEPSLQELQKTNKPLKEEAIRDQGANLSKACESKPLMEYIRCENIREIATVKSAPTASVKELQEPKPLQMDYTKFQGLKPWGLSGMKVQEPKKWPSPQPLVQTTKPREAAVLVKVLQSNETEPKEKRERLRKVPPETKVPVNTSDINLPPVTNGQSTLKRVLPPAVQENGHLPSTLSTQQGHRSPPRSLTTAEFCSSPCLPKDPELRKKKLDDLIDQIKGTYNFMQDSVLEFDYPSPRASSMLHLQSTPIVASGLQQITRKDLKSPMEVLPRSPPAMFQPNEPAVQMLSEPEATEVLESDIQSPNRSSTPISDDSYLKEESYVLGANAAEPQESSPNLEQPQAPLTLKSEESPKTPPKTPTKIQDLQLQPEGSPISPRSTPVHRSPSPCPFQGIQTVFNVHAPLPPSKEPELNEESYSPEFHQTFSTVSTQTLPPCPLDTSTGEQNVFIQEPLTGNPYTSGIHQVNGIPCYTTPSNMLPRMAQPYANRGSTRGTNRGRIMTNGTRCPYPYKGWSESSQTNSPERSEVFSSMDSGHGDSRSLTTSDMSMCSQATTLLPVHVYPLPQQMRVAFSTARTSNFAPGSLDQPIVFDLLLNNLGDTFDFQHGRFQCPVNGTYVFIFHMLKLAVNVPLYVNLMKNEEVLVSAYANDGAPDHETASNHAVLQLFQGDQIWLRLHRGAIYGSSWKYSTFSGYLLYQD